MSREELEHIIRAASNITKQADIVIIGSQSILGQYPSAKKALLISMEADVFPLNRPDLAIEIDGAIGERSLFHETHGIYAHGVDETTAILPLGWKQRLIPIRNENTGGGTGWCLEAHDLVVAKLAASREKDIGFVKELLIEKMINPVVVSKRIANTSLPPETKAELNEKFRHIQEEVLNPPGSFDL